MNAKSVTLLGCGWLGFPLAQLLALEGHKVKGTTTSEDKLPILSANSISGFLLNLQNQPFTLASELLNCQLLILAFPPKTKSTDGRWYSMAVEQIVRQAAQANVEKIILLSSTSVYPEVTEIITEEFLMDEETTGNKALYEAERAVLSFPGSYVLRLGGLAGKDRFLARHFSAKSQLKGGQHPVNLLHLEDAVRIVSLFVKSSPPAGIYNVCAPEHPLKEQLYTNDCLRFGYPLPEYQAEESSGKLISTEKLLKTTGYTFLHPDPAFFTYSN